MLASAKLPRYKPAPCPISGKPSNPPRARPSRSATTPPRSLAERVATTGVEAGDLAAAGAAKLPEAWIPGVEIFRGASFPSATAASLASLRGGAMGGSPRSGFGRAQWATARMFAGTGKGFHIHPPHIPEGEEPEAWFQRLFVTEPAAYALRPYDREQWDAMFFVQGCVEMLLVDERLGLPRRVMRFIIEGDDHRGPNNAGVVIPAGVAHALRVEGPADAIMVYGTTTPFEPAFEGRIADEIERPRWTPRGSGT